jgi:hypothetical protein
MRNVKSLESNIKYRTYITVCTENLNPDVVMMKSAEYRA